MPVSRHFRLKTCTLCIVCVYQSLAMLTKSRSRMYVMTVSHMTQNHVCACLMTETASINALLIMACCISDSVCKSQLIFRVQKACHHAHLVNKQATRSHQQFATSESNEWTKSDFKRDTKGRKQAMSYA